MADSNSVGLNLPLVLFAALFTIHLSPCTSMTSAPAELDNTYPTTSFLTSEVTTARDTTGAITEGVSKIHTFRSWENTLEDDLQLLLEPKIAEEKVFEIGRGLNKGQSVLVDNTQIFRSSVGDLCATELNSGTRTQNGNEFSVPTKFFCDRSKDGDDLQLVTVGISTSARLAELLNNNTINNAIYAERDTHLLVASDVITAIVFIGQELVSVPFKFALTHSTVIDEKFSSPTCRFWDVQRRNWNSTGCRDIESDNASMTSCYCDHMTSFAILVSLVPSDLEGDMISNILTWIGIGISIISLVISLITFFILRRSLTADRVIIHVNLMVAILIFDITFLSGINPIKIEAACKVHAFILHYSSLAMMFWMLVEGVHLYRQIIQVFDSGNTRTWVGLYGIIGWGLPAVVLAITGGLKHHSYGYERSCWLNPADGTIWAFSGPAIAIVLVNVVILLLVVKTVVSASQGQLENDKIKQIKAGLRSTVLLLPLLGITWLMIPLVAFFPRVKALEYTFNLINPLQGFFVALFYCFRNSEVRNAIKESIRKSRDSRASEIQLAPLTSETGGSTTVKPGVRKIRVAPAPECRTRNQTSE